MDVDEVRRFKQKFKPHAGYSSMAYAHRPLASKSHVLIDFNLGLDATKLSDKARLKPVSSATCSNQLEILNVLLASLDMILSKK